MEKINPIDSGHGVSSWYSVISIYKALLKEERILVNGPAHSRMKHLQIRKKRKWATRT
tara:strand:+ start:102 stop:275 length:174 start_codon:yes stop_codon:yes gene_type:complete